MSKNEITHERKRFAYAVKALVCHRGRFLLVQRSDKARGDHYRWELPGGGLEFGETPDEALVREVAEETGLFVKPLQPLSAWTFFKSENTQVLGLTTLCVADGGEVRLSAEHIDSAWITPEEIGEYDVVEGMIAETQKWDWQAILSAAKAASGK